MTALDKDELNRQIKNPIKRIDSLTGFEIIAESMVDKVYDLFGKNSLLSILYQIGNHTSEVITERIKKKYNKEEFEILEAFTILIRELKNFFSIQVREIEESERKLKIIVENHCFLRKPIRRRKKLDFGKAFCRINKGYFETAFKRLCGSKIKKVEINFIENDQTIDACVEELIFHLK